MNIRQYDTQRLIEQLELNYEQKWYRNKLWNEPQKRRRRNLDQLHFDSSRASVAGATLEKQAEEHDDQYDGSEERHNRNEAKQKQRNSKKGQHCSEKGTRDHDCSYKHVTKRQVS